MIVAGLALALAASAGPAAAASKDPSDPAARREQVRKQRAQKAAEIDAAKATDREVEAALNELNADVKVQEAQAAKARRSAAAAAQAALEAKRAEEVVATRVDELRKKLKALAVDAYVRGPAPVATPLGVAGDPSELARGRALIEFALGSRQNVVDAMEIARRELSEKRAAAVTLANAAAEQRKAVEGKLDSLEAARDRQSKVAAAAEARLERALAEADSLAALDKQLSAEIARRQAALARRIPAGRSGPGGAAGPIGNVSLRTVRGITVASSIADNLERMLAKAEAEGFVFGGGGYRSSEGQVATRRNNCGSSNYDIYEKPASQCSPPTARPGYSMHERGLAIDFTYGGRAIVSRSDPGFQWLNRNANNFGLYNLPSEPWHWSTNGN